MCNCYLNLFGFVFTVLFGSATHFFYDWSGKNPWVGLISPVNESVWEHMKLLTTPMILFTIFEYIVCGRYIDNYIPARLISILFGMAVIIIVFYTYVGILGDNCLILDILTFVIGVIATFSLNRYILSTDKFSSSCCNYAGWIGFLVLIFIMILFTFIPPHIALFRDSGTGKYGVSG